MQRTLRQELETLDSYFDTHKKFSVYDTLTNGSVYVSMEGKKSSATVQIAGVSFPQKRLFEIMSIIDQKHNVLLSVSENETLDKLHKLEDYVRRAVIHYAGTTLSAVEIYTYKEMRRGARDGATGTNYLSEKHYEYELFDDLFETVFGVRLPSYDPKYDFWWCDERREFVKEKGFEWKHDEYTPPNSKEEIHFTRILKKGFVPENIHLTIKDVLSLLETKEITHELATIRYEELKSEGLGFLGDLTGMEVKIADHGNGATEPKYRFSIDPKRRMEFKIVDKPTMSVRKALGIIKKVV